MKIGKNCWDFRRTKKNNNGIMQYISKESNKKTHRSMRFLIVVYCILRLAKFSSFCFAPLSVQIFNCLNRQDSVEKQGDDKQRRARYKCDCAKEEGEAGKPFFCIRTRNGKDYADKACADAYCHKVDDLNDRSRAFDDVKPRHKENECANKDGGKADQNDQKAKQQDDSPCRHIRVWLCVLLLRIFLAHTNIIQRKGWCVNKEKNFVFCAIQRLYVYLDYHDVIVAERHIRDVV